MAPPEFKMHRSKSFVDENKKLEIMLSTAADAMEAARESDCTRSDVKTAQDAVRTLARSIDAVEAIAEDQPTDELRRQVLDEAKYAREKKNAMTVELRRIGLRVQSDPLAMRNELLGKSSPMTPPESPSTEVAAKEITKSLAQTRQVVAQELARSEATKRVLVDSSATVRNTRDIHSGGEVADELASGKHTITSLNRQAKFERVRIFLALAFFAFVVLYILQKRVGQTRILAATSKLASLGATAARTTCRPFVVAVKMLANRLARKRLGPLIPEDDPRAGDSAVEL